MKKLAYCQSARRGYTLMEMLLVQGVIVALVAMSWPALRGSLDKNRLLAAARQVRTELVQARLKAAETGVAQQFRYQTGDRCYEVTAANPAAGLNSTSKDRFASISVDLPSTRDEAGDEECDTRLAMLDEEITFMDARTAESDDDKSGQHADARADVAVSNELGEENWSAPVVFLPNGRSHNARLRLAGPRGFHVDVSLRGLTGAVTVGELIRDQEVSE